MIRYCPTFWGSHGCDKPRWHDVLGDPVHQCGTDTEDPDSLDYNGGPCTQMIVLGPENDYYRGKDAPMNAAVRYSIGDPGAAHEGWGEWYPGLWFS